MVFLSMPLRSVAAGACSVLLMGTVTPAKAEDARKREFSIQEQSLASALSEFARQSRREILFTPDIVDEKRTSGVRGAYSALEALRSVLEGTGLTFSTTASGAILVKKSETSAAVSPVAFTRLAMTEAATSPGTAQHLAPASGAAADSPSEDADGEVLGQVIVRGARTRAATKMDTPILKIPQNIQVLSAQLLDDIGADLLEDALRHVGGVQVGGHITGWDFFRVRGFSSTTYVDGLRTADAGAVNLNVELFGVDRVEVLKGPSGTLYGGGLLSGMVNIVTKQPRQKFFFDASVTGGQHDFKEGAVDFGGSLNSDQTVYARLPVVYREEGTFVEHSDGLERFYAAPSLTWEISDDTRVTLLTSYQHNRSEVAFPIPAQGTVLPNPNGRIPIDRFIGNGNDPGVVRDSTWTVGYQFMHRFNDVVSFRQNARFAHRDTSWDALLYGWTLDADMRTFYRFPYYIDHAADRRFAIDAGLDFEFSTGGVSHYLTVGADFEHARAYTTERESDLIPGMMPIDLFDRTDLGEAPMPDLYVLRSARRAEPLGFYVQDRMELTDRLSVMIGGRYQHEKGGWAFDTTDVGQVRMSSGSAFAPNAGLTFEIIPDVVAFASYSEAFRGQFDALVAGGDSADPEQGVQYEAGIKTGLFDNRINSTISLYELRRENVRQPDLLNPGFVTLTGEQRSRGFEIDSHMQVRPNWEVIATYAYTDTEVVNDTRLQMGSAFQGVPKTTFSLWSKYAVASGPLQGLSFSIGGSYYSSQLGKTVLAPQFVGPGEIRSFELPSYTLVNAAVDYEWDRFRLQLNINNLLDEEYFPGSNNEYRVLPGNPRRVRLSLAWRY